MKGAVQNEIVIKDIKWEQNRISIIVSPNKYTIPSTRYVIELKSKNGQSYGKQSYNWAVIREIHLTNPEYSISRDYFVYENKEETKPIAERKTTQELVAELFTIVITKE